MWKPRILPSARPSGPGKRKRRQECDGVDFVGSNRPINGITGVNPEFIGKKGDNLPPFVLALRPDRGLPSFGLDGDGK